jgi:hypothetical protein
LKNQQSEAAEKGWNGKSLKYQDWVRAAAGFPEICTAGTQQTTIEGKRAGDPK